MSNSIKTTNIIIIVFISFILGFFVHRFYAIYRYQNPVLEQKKKKRKLPIDFEIPKIDKWLIKYQDGMPVFSDRNYYNRKKTSFFNDCYLLSAPRHDTIGSIIIPNQNITIYRLIPDKPSKKDFNKWIHDWKKEEITVNVIGGFMDQKKVVSKKFQALDTIFLLPSGKMSSTPFLLRPDSNSKFSIEILK